MPPDVPQTPRGRPVPSAGERRERPPSRAAQARLSGALRDRADAYRHDASIDLTIVEALLRLDEAEAAAKTIDDHRASLQAMARDLQVVVADAAVEREAESVCEAVATQFTPARPATGLRRRVLALTGAAAVVVALVLPTARFSPRTTLASLEGRSAADSIASARERFETAKSWASALRADAAASTSTTAAPSTRAAIVAHKVRTILAADTPGGPAATSASPTADVVDLAGYREGRAGGPATSKPPADEPTRTFEVDPLPDPVPAVPKAGVPMGLDLDAESAGAADVIDLEAETGNPLP